MVARSIDNWEQHKKEVREKLLNSGQHKENVEIFMEHYAKVYDPFDRSFLHYPFAYSMFEDLNYVRNIGTRYIGCVGLGGSGKSTLMKNLLYFMDQTFDVTRIHFELMPGSIKQMQSFQLVNAKKAILLDEPDDTYHPQSKEGKILRSVYGKSRQQGLIYGICATDLKDIPIYIFRKLHTLIFLPCHGKGFVIRDIPQQMKFPLQEFRELYAQKGWAAFSMFIKQRKNDYMVFSTHKACVISKEEQDRYILQKQKDYDKTINSLLNPKEQGTKKEQGFVKLVKHLWEEKGYSHKKIAEITGYSRQMVGYVLKNADASGQMIVDITGTKENQYQ